MNQMRIAVVSPFRQHLDEVARVLHEATDAAKISVFESTLRHAGNFSDQAIPDLLIVDSGNDGSSDLRYLEQLGRMHRNMAFIVLCDTPTPEFLIQAMRVGVREVLPSPATGDALKAALERIRPQLGFSTESAGKILAFVSCKGGSGATFLAANLACELAAHGKRVALLDCHLQFGDALLFLTEQKPATTLSDVARNIHRLDPAFLASSMVNVAPNLSVLAAPEDPAHGMEVTPDQIESILKLARAEYDFVIADVSRTLDAQTIKVLDHADTIYGVLQLTLPYIRDGKRLVDIFHTLDYPKNKVQLVVNRYQQGGDIGLDALEKSCGTKVARTIPNHYEAVAASVNQGIPIARLARSSPVTRMLAEWGDELAKAEKRPQGAWVSRLLHRARRLAPKRLQSDQAA